MSTCLNDLVVSPESSEFITLWLLLIKSIFCETFACADLFSMDFILWLTIHLKWSKGFFFLSDYLKPSLCHGKLSDAYRNLYMVAQD